MHAPDGFLNAGTAVATGAISVGGVGVALRQARQRLDDRRIPLAGLAAAFIFAAQMVNFPVAGGTTGHLLGGALAAILLGPAVGALVVTVVVVVQALAFADGGLTALGYNVLNMAIVTSFGGYAVFRLLRRLVPETRSGVVVATGIASGVSVVLSAAAFSIQWLFGASAPVPFDTVFGAMVGVHLLIGVGEGVISALTVGAVLRVRPDLVHGAAGDEPATGEPRRPLRRVLLVGAAVTILIAVGVSQLATPGPDGLERVAAEHGFADSAVDHAFSDSVFADYATAGVADESTSLAVAGVTGSLVTGTVGAGLLLAVRDRRDKPGRAHADMSR